MTHSDFVPASKPALWDVRGCEEWLARATLADSHHACSAFLSLLDELEDAPPRHAPYLQILERLRDPVLIAQEENAKKFAARPLPLGHVESAAFSQACDLWTVLVHAYHRLLRAALKGSRPELAASIPLLCARAIECTGELIGAHFLARREIGEELWRSLHADYALAERQGVVDVAVAEPRSRMPSTSTCTTAYARVLMLALAHPYGLKEREFAWARRWTRRWAEKARVGPEPQRGYRIDLSGTIGPQWDKGCDGKDSPDGAPASEATRYLDFADVAHSIKWRLRKLKEGSLPAELGLGRDCIQPAAGELLGALLSSLTRPSKSRQFPRRLAHSATELASGMTQIHAALGGEAIVEDIRHWHYNRRDAEQIQISQHAAGFEARRRDAASNVEQWHTLDESASGFRLHRRGPGVRLAHRQLVALRPQGAQQFILCELRWLIQNADQTLTIGARALVGRAQPVSVRPLAEAPANPSPFSHALVLPVARDLPASIVLPGGWHQPGRTLDLRADRSNLHIRLTELLARGYDFDHARFEFVA